MLELRCCCATSCRLADAGRLRRALVQAARRRGLGPEVVRIKPVGCLRLCSGGPLVAVASDAHEPWRALVGAVPPALAPCLLAWVIPFLPSSKPWCLRAAGCGAWCWRGGVFRTACCSKA